jgi:hypothetical protein
VLRIRRASAVAAEKELLPIPQPGDDEIDGSTDFFAAGVIDLSLRLGACGELVLDE